MPTPPNALTTVKAVAKGTAPLVLKARGWVLAALVLVPVLGAILVAMIIAAQGEGRAFMGSRIGLVIFHSVLVQYMVPIMALVAAGAGIREDMEQRTLPLMLTRPAPVQALPLGKALPWFLWGSLWLLIGTATLQVLGGDFSSLLGRMAALVGIWWAELAFVTCFGLAFKKGTLWAALWLFIWESLLDVFPATMQRLTFTHYANSLAGSRYTASKAHDLLAQTQVDTPVLLAFLILLAFGAACWAWAGWKLHRMPIGLAGAEGEG
ncbi:MAG TPA: hypothetical protein VJ623_14035 [Holophagaceae bacterium]|nr:hypothetical protein [Holophagaceae bacterium]